MSTIISPAGASILREFGRASAIVAGGSVALVGFAAGGIGRTFAGEPEYARTKIAAGAATGGLLGAAIGAGLHTGSHHVSAAVKGAALGAVMLGLVGYGWDFV